MCSEIRNKGESRNVRKKDGSTGHRNMEYICDSICHYPHILNAEELENKCADCKMDNMYVTF